MKLKSIVFASAILVLAAMGWAAGSNALALNPAAVAADKHPDFSGTWKADMGKSDFGPMGGPDERIDVIDHKDPKLKIKSTLKGGPRPGDSESNYTTDGTESINKRGPQDVKTVAKWDGAKLVMTTKLNAQGMDINITATYALSADGKVLTIDSVINTPQGDFNTKVVFNKSE
jgi:hypothetical protein